MDLGVLGQKAKAWSCRYVGLTFHVNISTSSTLTNLQLRLQVPQLFGGLGRLPVGVTQLDLHLIQISLHLFLHPGGVVSAARLGVQRVLQSVHASLVIPLELVDFFVFLCHLSVNFRLDLI